MQGTIYGLIDSDTLELRYVGQTTQELAKRFKAHTKSAHGITPYNVPLAAWLISTPVNIVALERDPEDINEAEIRWIREMREQGARLLNLTDGGDRPPSQQGNKHADATRARISTALLGNKNPMWGRAHTSETRAKMSALKMGNKNRQGCIHTAETLAKMSAALRGKGLGNQNARRKENAEP